MGKSIKVTLDSIQRGEIPAVYAPTNALAPTIAHIITRYLTTWFPGQDITVDTDNATVYVGPYNQPVSPKRVGTYTVVPNAIDEAAKSS